MHSCRLCTLAHACCGICYLYAIRLCDFHRWKLSWRGLSKCINDFWACASVPNLPALMSSPEVDNPTCTELKLILWRALEAGQVTASLALAAPSSDSYKLKASGRMPPVLVFLVLAWAMVFLVAEATWFFFDTHATDFRCLVPVFDTIVYGGLHPRYTVVEVQAAQVIRGHSRVRHMVLLQVTGVLRFSFFFFSRVSA